MGVKKIIQKLQDKFFPEDDYVPTARTLFIVFVVLILLFAVSKAHSAPFNQMQCQALAEFAGAVAVTRDVGADQTKHSAAVAKANQEQGPEIVSVLVETVKKVYASKLDPDQIRVKVFVECMTKGIDPGKGV